jgi:Ni/Fe-hydrogenase subunit HybB-like protein
MSDLVRKITFWRVLLLAIFAGGLYGCYLRFFKGFEAATNLSDAQPWGFWVGGATLCGIGLSAGGFAIAAAIYLLGMERYRPLARVSVLISLLGYGSVCVGYAYELGLPWRFYYILLYQNTHSILFDVGVCVISYTAILVLEFAPQVLEKLPWRGLSQRLLHWHHKIVIVLVLVGTLLSSMHQSFLGGLFLIMKGHIYPLWYSPYIHTMFYMTAIPSGLCMVIITVHLSMRSFGVRFDYDLLADLAKVVVPMLSIYGVFRMADLVVHGGYKYLFRARMETGHFWLENFLLVIVPVMAFSFGKIRNTPSLLFWTSWVEVMGFIVNRWNVSVTAMEATSHANYVPKWPEVMITTMVIAGAVVVFRLCVIYLEVFPRRDSAVQSYCGLPG